MDHLSDDSSDPDTPEAFKSGCLLSRITLLALRCLSTRLQPVVLQLQLFCNSSQLSVTNTISSAKSILHGYSTLTPSSPYISTFPSSPHYHAGSAVGAAKPSSAWVALHHLPAFTPLIPTSPTTTSPPHLLLRQLSVCSDGVGGGCTCSRLRYAHCLGNYERCSQVDVISRVLNISKEKVSGVCNNYESSVYVCVIVQGGKAKKIFIHGAQEGSV
ncbi:hypothetical protein Pcinc_022395 [Petrolisthes cinctipes]|uniref:Uncharacterized protein n=1 Tax=Petrolisthes cinctipes TaxID=88211 RepID=A0AAE1FHU0_PETCI|nr:hypothetical protein Pcinc_022395 [Petrolisthes cinctipes]